MNENPKSFLEELQSLEEPVKSRVLIVSSVLVMAIVVYFWLGYVNSLVTTVPAPTVAEQDQPAQSAQPASGPGLFGQIGNGMAAIAHSFGQLWETPRKYVVKPE